MFVYSFNISVLGSVGGWINMNKNRTEEMMLYEEDYYLYIRNIIKDLDMTEDQLTD